MKADGKLSISHPKAGGMRLGHNRDPAVVVEFAVAKTRLAVRTVRFWSSLPVGARDRPLGTFANGF